MAKEKTGFEYCLSMRKIKEYKSFSIEKRLSWLYQANLFRKAYPKKTIALQDRFRAGDI